MSEYKDEFTGKNDAPRATGTPSAASGTSAWTSACTSSSVDATTTGTTGASPASSSTSGATSASQATQGAPGVSSTWKGNAGASGTSSMSGASTTASASQATQGAPGASSTWKGNVGASDTSSMSGASTTTSASQATQGAPGASSTWKGNVGASGTSSTSDASTATGATDTYFDIEFTAPNAAAAVEKPASSRKKKNIILCVVAALVVLICAGIFAGAMSSGSQTSYGDGDPYVGVLYVTGTISSSTSYSSQSAYNHTWLLNQVEYMKNDPQNEGIMLYINSPGGSVYESDELYLKLMEYKEETERPLYAYFAQEAASGAYYIAAGSDKITANRNCVTGSIGVYSGPYMNVSELLSNLGVEVEYIKSAKNKAMGNNYEALTDEQRSILQEYVNECYEQFLTIVSDGRDIDIETLRPIADGRIYTAAQAKENGLIDEVGDFDSAKSLMKAEQELSCEFVTVKYTQKKDLYSILTNLEDLIRDTAADMKKSDLDTALELLEKNEIEISYLAPEIK